MSRSQTQNAPASRRPIAVDLFAGAGGMSLGFEQAGFDVVAAVEYDPVHAATHAFNFPLGEVLVRDIADVAPDEIEGAVARGCERHGREWSAREEIDVVVGGPPCQGFSNIGKRLVDDPRNGLVFHFFRLVNEIKPRYFVMENVPGMMSGGHRGILQRLVEEFEHVGYRVIEPQLILNAADFGVPQDRRRLFVLGYRNDQEPLEYPQAKVQALPKRHLRGRKSDGEKEGPVLPLGPSVWDAIGDLPDADRFKTLLDSDSTHLRRAQLEALENRASRSRYSQVARGQVRDPEDFSWRRDWDPGVLTSSARTGHTEASIARFSETSIGETEPISRFYRLDPKGLCNTLRAGTGSERGAHTSPRPIHPRRPRVITVREAARLHSFPDWFRFHETKWHGFRQIGNAVAPFVGRAVGEQVISALGTKPRRPRRKVELGNPELLSMNESEASEYFGDGTKPIPSRRRRPARAA